MSGRIADMLALFRGGPRNLAMFVPHLCLMLDLEFLGQLTDEDRARAVARQLAEQLRRVGPGEPLR